MPETKLFGSWFVWKVRSLSSTDFSAEFCMVLKEFVLLISLCLCASG